MVAAAARTRQARAMTGGGLLELILISMAWLFFVGGIATNYHVLRRSLRRKTADEQVPSGLGFVPGVVGSITVFFTIPALARYGVEVPWPWLWILLPLVIDPYCLAGLVLLLARK
jgi:hypothetical protein